MSVYTPNVTFNRFTKNGVTVDISSGTVTIASGTMSGVYENEDKYIYSFAISPAEPTTVTPQIYEMVMDINPNDADEGYVMMPFSHGGAVSHGNDERFGNVPDGVITQMVWSAGSGVGTIDIGYSGVQLVFSGADFPASGSLTWEAEMIGSSGSAVVDVPTVWYGSFIAMIDASTNWDKIQQPHDLQIIKPHVGHNVRITNASGTFSSGTFNDDIINIMGTDPTGMWINVKTYHEHTEGWALFFSGVEKQQGYLTHVSDTWLHIEDLYLSGTSYDVTYELRLYASGTESVILHPNPLRTIDINIYIYEERGRFGVGRFGVSRFGLAETDY
jgi:hypothetical protein